MNIFNHCSRLTFFSIFNLKELSKYPKILFIEVIFIEEFDFKFIKQHFYKYFIKLNHFNSSNYFKE
jgi:hypothetical protein